jgi:hypothetical protein
MGIEAGTEEAQTGVPDDRETREETLDGKPRNARTSSQDLSIDRGCRGGLKGDRWRL